MLFVVFFGWVSSKFQHRSRYACTARTFKSAVTVSKVGPRGVVLGVWGGWQKHAIWRAELHKRVGSIVNCLW